jgi:hypothetical protein
MIKVDAGNVLLKPSHRRQLMGWLRRAVRLGERVGDFMLTVTIKKIGRFYEVRATVHDAAGNFDCRVRKHDWRTAVRDLVWALTGRLHAQQLARA